VASRTRGKKTSPRTSRAGAQLVALLLVVVVVVVAEAAVVVVLQLARNS
jgi:hypothetical protein